MAEWRTARLGEIIKTNQSTYSPKENWRFVNYLDTGNITMNRIDEIQYINPAKDKLPSRARRKVKTNSIIYSTVRPNQLHYGIINEQPDNFLVSTGFAVIDVDCDKAVPNFIYYALTKQEVTEQLQAIAEQSVSTYPSIKPSDIENLELMFPDIKMQERIVSILSLMDEKIKNNNAINNNLSDQIKTICTAWLSDYAPFGGILPDDWSKTPLSSIADFVSGYSYKGTELTESNIAMATIKNFDRKGGFKLDGYKEIVPSNKLKDTQHAELFDTLVAHTDLTQNAEVIGNAEPVMSKSGYSDIVFSMDLVKVVPKNNHISKFFIAAILQDKKFKAHCLGYVNGTTVLHLSKKALPEYQLYLPDDLSALKPLDELITALYQQISANIEEIAKLEALRDTILPKLMSGELDVSNIDL
ncbi:restriction endonuclease subunit S [Filifactor alocis]|uniref:restriction endonuclease subunit S n=1 Tax=Filifactor alocis TaxID=143361 RepID=UPI003FA0655C